MSLSRIMLILALWLFSSVCAANAVPEILRWHYVVVSTPGFYGPPKTNSSQYRAPNPIKISMPERLPCTAEELMGAFEAVVQSDGVVKNARYYPPSGTSGRTEATVCQKQYIIPLINGWQFTPATYEEKPIEVIIRVFVEPKW